MQQILTILSTSPLLALIGLTCVLAFVFTPAVLSLAGLTGVQIIELLRATMEFVLQVIREFRHTNSQPKQ